MPPTFKLPDWATTPTRTSSIIDSSGASSPVDLKPAYIFGTDPSTCDFAVPSSSPNDPGSHVAALVHHGDGRTFLISLSDGSLSLDGAPLPLHKPTALKRGSTISFSSPNGNPSSFVFECESSGTKRDRSDNGGGAVTSVRASHLLVKHQGSRRPSSWKEPVVTRSLEEARQMVSAFRDEIVEESKRGGGFSSPEAALAAAFARAASTESHCSSARNGGDLGQFSRGQMQRGFENAAFGLRVGELSGLVETDSGVHIILRTE